MSPGIIDNNDIIYNFTDAFIAYSLLRNVENIYCEIVKKTTTTSVVKFIIESENLFIKFRQLEFLVCVYISEMKRIHT